MNIHIVNPGSFKLDGGATFGVIPKTLWQKVYPADENNLCPFALRSLLIETDSKLVLIDTGIGNKQDDKFYKYYFREGHHNMVKSIEEAGFSASDVTDVVLTHLHFDHVGGAVEKDRNGDLRPTFPNASYHLSKQQWDWAMNPNQREKASYLEENILPLATAKVLNLIADNTTVAPGIELRLFFGHTDGLIVPYISYKNKTLIYTSDLIPLAANIPPSWVCGYDTRPLISFEERSEFLKDALASDAYLVFQHDYFTECCSLTQSEKGIVLKDKYTLKDIL